MVFAIQKYQHYLLADPLFFFNYHQALKYSVNKPLHHGRIYHWMLLFQQFEFEVVLRLGKINVIPDHLSQVHIGEELTRVDDNLPNTHLFQIEYFRVELEEIAHFLENGQ